MFISQYRFTENGKAGSGTQSGLPWVTQPGKQLSHSSSLSLKCLGLGPDLNHFFLYLPSLLSLKKEARRVPERE